MNKFSTEEQEFIRCNVKGKTVLELTEVFNKKFNKAVSIEQIRNYKKKNKLRSEVITLFQKGQNPHNKKSIGSEFICKEGYTFIKVAEPNTWQLKHRYIYEKK